ncbi:DUF5677 domain-containing protein [Methylorubrum populi]
MSNIVSQDQIQAAEVDAGDVDTSGIYAEAKSSFEESVQLAINISNATGGLFVKPRFGLASFLFTKQCSIGISILKICHQDEANDIPLALDHTSICSLCRNMFEASIMFSYLAQRDISDEQWRLRQNVIWLRDATSRYKMFKGWKAEKEASGFKEHMLDLRTKISSDNLFGKLDEERRKKILAGSEMYVNGLRGAVKQCGWDKDQFEATYTYLSQHSHNAPVSFLRMAEHGINYARPSNMQFSVAAYAIEVANQSLRVSSKRLAEVYPEHVTEHPFEDLEYDTDSPFSHKIIPDVN